MKRIVTAFLALAVALAACGPIDKASAPADVQKLAEAVCFTDVDLVEFVAEKLQMSVDTVLGYMAVPLDCTEVEYLGEVKTSDETTSYVFVYKDSEGLGQWWVFQIENQTGLVVGID